MKWYASCPRVFPVHQVDQLLEYHFEEDMTRLTQHCGKKLTEGRQTIIVSATLKQEVSLTLHVLSTAGHHVTTIDMASPDLWGHLVHSVVLDCTALLYILFAKMLLKCLCQHIKTADRGRLVCVSLLHLRLT